MWDFLIVLGQIPGTNIQITFNELLYTCVFAIIGYMMIKQRLQLSHEANVFSKAVKKEVRATKRSLKKKHKANAKLLKSFKRKALVKTKSKIIKDITTGKQRARQRAT